MDPAIVGLVEEAAENCLPGDWQHLHSGAIHDAGMMASVVPSGTPVGCRSHTALYSAARQYSLPLRLFATCRILTPFHLCDPTAIDGHATSQCFVHLHYSLTRTTHGIPFLQACSLCLSSTIC